MICCVSADRPTNGHTLLGAFDVHFHDTLCASCVLDGECEQNVIAQPRPKLGVVHRQPLAYGILQADIGHFARDVAPRQQVDPRRN